jgi:hypothetical protein
MCKTLAVGLLLAFLLLTPTVGLWADTSTDVFTFTGTWAVAAVRRCSLHAELYGPRFADAGRLLL